MKAVTLNCETCGGPHSFNDCPATVGNNQNVHAAGAYQGNSYHPHGNRNLLSYRSDIYLGPLGSETLPGNTITNPKEELKRITTRCGTAYQAPTISTTSSLPPVVECETEATKDTVHPTNKGSTKNVQPPIVQTESPILNSEPVIAPIIEPVVSLKLPEKLGDPEKFLILCDFPGMRECLALAGLGASINLMPLSVWNKLSLPELTPTLMTLELVDRSTSRPIGVAKDVFVKVGTFHFPADFVVIDFDADPRVPLILERTFRKTERDFIDVFEVNRIDVIEMACEEYSQEVLDFFDVIATKTDKYSIDEPLEVELKDLPPHLEFAFLEGDDKLPVIIEKDLSVEEKTTLIPVLKSHKKTLNQWFNIREESILKSKMSSRMRMRKRCEDTNLCLNWEKSHFMVKEGIVLGHKIYKNGIEVDKAKVNVIAKLPYPTTVKGIRSFLGHARFYRRFIQDFSKIAGPMTRLLEKDTTLFFSKECVEAFKTLKRKLTEASILTALDWDFPFELMCDARDLAISVVLGQRQEKHFRPIHYARKTMTEAESNYTIMEKEMLAVVYAFEKFRSYLIMNKSIMYTNHSALKYLFAKKDSKARLLRWVLLL
nr:reverse transcriptase domain-containing protein [Tanacetum cinerariifolium]